MSQILNFFSRYLMKFVKSIYNANNVVSNKQNKLKYVNVYINFKNGYKVNALMSKTVYMYFSAMYFIE